MSIVSREEISLAPWVGNSLEAALCPHAAPHMEVGSCCKSGVMSPDGVWKGERRSDFLEFSVSSLPVSPLSGFILELPVLTVDKEQSFLIYLQQT